MKAGHVVAIAALLGGLWSQPASAQDPVLTCQGSNYCSAYSGSIAYDTTTWGFDSGWADLLLPAYCDGTLSCPFYCPTSPGMITVTVTFWSGGQVVATASSDARCTPEPI
ncbi:hypothetical protein D7X30_19060 [Corallococcus sp. AB011P]|uniref:hypothetical protein n=1 Tax=unclassified Corallococcus TaxID=2685029 RepID=UPI000EA29065|nr:MULTISPECIES: hypothetical protein [unclassified Corallococcus]RKG57600.1 hypothetical protein D7X30_19060 [Corallococcus sp. AB011P]RKH88762.1 hypothetical protein D7Y21_13655 [Corallococcus sp. AB045]